MSRYRVSNRGFGTERLTENQGKAERNIYVFCLTAATAHTFLINEIAQEHNLSALLTNFPC